ncbi:MAG: recombination protein RecR [Microgenomates group bacterium Gr01-1014_16]|nr:MAG: recombination protein RecR [Microgenomates group bacterium Gr01-1014_16]
MKVAKAVTGLIEAFERLPGIGPKTAARLTYYLLHVPQAELDRFASAVSDLKRNTVECEICHNISETSPCDICDDPNRDKSLICVVEQPLDVLAIERGDGYKGVYHVLHGTIDPLHNIGPDEIKISPLISRIQDSRFKIQEIILALNPNMEGEATSLYIKRMINDQCSMFNIKMTRLAHGLPVGGDIEYADDRTLTHAMEGRREY